MLSDRTEECWGDNDYGQLGIGVFGNGSHSWMPVAVSGLSNVTAIASGEYHTCALLSGGIIQCWGANGAGQLGNGSASPSLTPAAVKW